jgi:hypothetical protein
LILIWTVIHRHVDLNRGTIETYQKNGVTVDGPGSTAVRPDTAPGRRVQRLPGVPGWAA